MKIYVNIESADALLFKADVLALKFAQQLYGVDSLVVNKLFEDYENCRVYIPEGEYQIVDTQSKMGVKKVLFLGVQQLYDFQYEDIREFCFQVLKILQEKEPQTKHLALTLHGVGYGLEEEKILTSELLGIQQAIKKQCVPSCLELITIVERNTWRAEQLARFLERILPSYNTLAMANQYKKLT